MEEHDANSGQKHPVPAGDTNNHGRKALRQRTREDLTEQEAIQDEDDQGNEDNEEFGFEDPFGDEFEEEDEGSNDEDPEDNESNLDEVTEPLNNVEIEDENENQHPEQVRAWRPGIDKLEEGEELEYDNSAYEMYHSIHAEWPCLSFDIIHDNLGQGRSIYPMSLIIAAGTQSDDNNDKVTLMKLSGMGKCKEVDDDDDDDSEDDDDDDNDDPTIQHFNASHYGCVNRLRCMPQDNGIIATWSEQGSVNVFNLTRISNLLTSSGSLNNGNLNKNRLESTSSPILTFRGHASEGYALDWNRLTTGLIASGDNDGLVNVFNIQTPGKHDVHRLNNAVQDIQWSQSESSVFVSACNRGHLHVSDTRSTSKPMLSSTISTYDVNVVSWNRSVSYLLATGDDNGVIRIFDIRSWSNSTTLEPSLTLTYHKQAITSIEWDPNDEASLVASSMDDSTTIFDVSVEYNDDDDENDKMPPQLLFVHQGQEQIKEVHYHSQIPGLIACTSATGFSVFKPRFQPNEEENDEVTTSA